MTELTTEKRKELPESAFAGLDRSYPIPDRSHAGNAKARAKQSLNKGILSQSAFDRIVTRANKILKRDDSK